ncbi:SIMPL domain-containing protein [Caldicellulosiruptor acetigenus]|uniref:SIMPL domain-containing protein n=1 Tax=Caldicellulosiruptor acetigenus TaxID=301953 RepID=UPI0004232CD4|nr:SIMPL domain-containing protein [Caldicellulosiruptor acetigenus]WAM37286.1 SIMPL domain-containing protein [Caldicellulosiruptor acetigenus]
MKNKKIVAVSLASLLLLLATFLVFFARKVDASSASVQPKTEITVKGQASVYVEPDIAILTFGVVSEDISADAAYSQTAAKINKTIDAVKKLGIDPKDIKTLRVNVYPKYSYNKDDGTSKIVGFYASTDLTVTVRNLSIVGKVIDTAFKNGVNTFSSLTFDVSNSSSYYNQALSKALENAKQKASTIAKGLGISLGKPKSVTENSYVNNPPIVYYKAEAMASSTSTQIQPGTIEIKAEVTLVY